MPTELTFISALLIGLLGSTHCIGMCTGIAGILVAGTAEPVRRSRWRIVRYLVTYNSGRISSYIIAGVIAGSAGAAAGSLLPTHIGHTLAMIISAAFLIALGLYISGWWTFLTSLEKFGATLWRHLEPIGHKVMPVRSLPQALLLGMVWGWLPCGLVYSALAWSLASGSAVQGGVLMLGFGLGTLPTVMSLGVVGDALKRLRNKPGVRQTAGVLLVLVGVWSLWGSSASTHDHSHPQHHVVAETVIK